MPRFAQQRTLAIAAHPGQLHLSNLVRIDIYIYTSIFNCMCRCSRVGLPIFYLRLFKRVDGDVQAPATSHLLITSQHNDRRHNLVQRCFNRIADKAVRTWEDFSKAIYIYIYMCTYLLHMSRQKYILHGTVVLFQPTRREELAVASMCIDADVIRQAQEAEQNNINRANFQRNGRGSVVWFLRRFGSKFVGYPP